MRRLLVFLLFISAAGAASLSETAFYFDDKQTDQTSSAAVEGAKRTGSQQGAADIAACRFQIIEYGEPVPEPLPPVVPRDSTTGYAILSLHDCMLTPAFEAHVRAYNDTMRRWHAEHSK